MRGWKDNFKTGKPIRLITLNQHRLTFAGHISQLITPFIITLLINLNEMLDDLWDITRYWLNFLIIEERYSLQIYI